MEQRSGASGQLEQPIGKRPKDSGTSLGNSQTALPGGAGGNGPMNAQNANQPELQSGSRGSNQGVRAGTRGGGQHGPLSDANMAQGGSMGNQQSGMQGGGRMGQSSGTPSVQRDGSMGAQESTDRAGSETDSNRYPAGGGTHQSNDTMGGLPRSPGNSGPGNMQRDTHLTGAQNHADQQKQAGGVHQSNDMAGGYPKSPGGANKLAADQKMDDDTGFSNKG
jgi:hypothetical protein